MKTHYPEGTQMSFPIPGNTSEQYQNFNLPQQMFHPA